MLVEFIDIIESLGVSLLEFTQISIILFIWSKPIYKLIKRFFKGEKINV